MDASRCHREKKRGRPGSTLLRLGVLVIHWAAVSCVATPLPLPPELDPQRMELVAPGQEQVLITGLEGALDPPDPRELILSNLSRGGAVSVLSEASGGFRAGLLGLTHDSYRVEARVSGLRRLLLECTSDNLGGVVDLSTLDGTDADGDGFGVSRDCDDADPTVNPAAPELCDGLDNDCDGEVDERCGEPCSGDADCDDGDPTTIDRCLGGLCQNEPICTPLAEICDGLDNDCDGLVDEGCGADPCLNDGDCDDGLYCNGAERCVEGLCLVSSAVACDDGDASTFDYCSELERSCQAE